MFKAVIYAIKTTGYIIFNKKSNGYFDFQLKLCFESTIRTLLLQKPESIRFIGSADPLKLLFKSAIFHPLPKPNQLSVHVQFVDISVPQR